MNDDNQAPVQCPVFHDMTLDERREVLELMQTESYPPGDVVLRQGKSTQFLWIIVSGTCEVVRSCGDGTEQVLAELGQGAVFGEMSFFNPAPHSASIRAVTELEVMRLPRDRYDELLETDSHAAWKIAANTVAVLAQRLRRMDDWTAGLVESPDVERHREEWREFRAKLYTDWEF